MSKKIYCAGTSDSTQQRCGIVVPKEGDYCRYHKNQHVVARVSDSGSEIESLVERMDTDITRVDELGPQMLPMPPIPMPHIPQQYPPPSYVNIENQLTESMNVQIKTRQELLDFRKENNLQLTYIHDLVTHFGNLNTNTKNKTPSEKGLLRKAMSLYYHDNKNDPEMIKELLGRLKQACVLHAKATKVPYQNIKIVTDNKFETSSIEIQQAYKERAMHAIRGKIV